MTSRAFVAKSTRWEWHRITNEHEVLNVGQYMVMFLLRTSRGIKKKSFELFHLTSAAADDDLLASVVIGDSCELFCFASGSPGASCIFDARRVVILAHNY